MNYIKEKLLAFDSFCKNQTETRAERIALENKVKELSLADQWIRDGLKKIVPEFEEALDKNDYLSAAQKLGVIKFFNHPYYNYLLGDYYNAVGDFSKSIEQYQQVSPESDRYITTLSKLAFSYAETGDYCNLVKLLESSSHQIPNITALFLRLNCIGNMRLDDFIAKADDLKSIPSPSIQFEKDDRSFLFLVCTAFAEALVFGVLCIKKCIIYKERVSKAQYDFDKIPETAKIVATYNKCIYALSLADNFNYFQIEGSADSLRGVALDGYSWEEKIRILRTTHYEQNIEAIVFDMLRPERFPDTPIMTVLSVLRSLFLMMEHRQLEQIISMYFVPITEAAKTGTPIALNYLGYSYNLILSTDSDPFNLKDRIETFLQENPAINLERDTSDMRLSLKMTRQGYSALQSAEHLFVLTEDEDKPYGLRDASVLALSFFRVFEFEYNIKLIIPFAKALDYEQITKLTGFKKESNGKFAMKDTYTFNRWGKDVISLYMLCSEAEEKQSLEIGVIRTLLAHIIDRDDKCAKLLRETLERCLTPDGINALYSHDLVDTISRTQTDRFRNPGAHTGFCTYSEACNAREYVRACLPKIETWFP